MIAEHIRRHGVDLRLGEEVEEVLADDRGRVRAVRGSVGGEYPCQMLGISIGVRPAIGWLAKVTTPPAMGRGISGHAGFPHVARERLGGWRLRRVAADG